MTTTAYQTASDKLNAYITAMSTEMLLISFDGIDAATRETEEGRIMTGRITTEIERRLPDLDKLIGELIDADLTYEITYDEHFAAARAQLGIS